MRKRSQLVRASLKGLEGTFETHLDHFECHEVAIASTTTAAQRRPVATTTRGFVRIVRKRRLGSRSRISLVRTKPQKKKTAPEVAVCFDKGRLVLRDALGLDPKNFSRLIKQPERRVMAAENRLPVPIQFLEKYEKAVELINALGDVIDPAKLGDWLKNPNEAFDGLSPIDLIEKGREDILWDMHYRLASGAPC